MSRILIIEDEEVIVKALTRLLERNRYEVTSANSVEEALTLEPRGFDLVLADLRLPGVLGTEIIVHADPVPVVIMTSHASVRSAVDAMRAGAIDYVAKPFDHDELLLVIERSLSQNRLQAQNNALLMDMRRLLPAPAILSCTEIGQVHEKIQTQFHQQRFLFIAGERGVGREWLARLLHWHGERQNGPFVIADTPLLRQEPMEQLLLGGHSGVDRHGMLQAAQGGTLVIRQPSLLAADVQEKLAATLSRRGLNNPRDGRVFNVQVILVSDTSLTELQTTGQMVEALAALFTDCCIELKPLREQHQQLHPLLQALILHHSKRHNVDACELDPSAVAAVQAYRWDGNAQELDRSIERAVLAAQGRTIAASDLGLGVTASNASDVSSRDLSLDEYFRYFVLRHQGSCSETELASRLGISRKALWERRQKIGLLRPKTGAA